MRYATFALTILSWALILSGCAHIDCSALPKSQCLQYDGCKLVRGSSRCFRDGLCSDDFIPMGCVER